MLTKIEARNVQGNTLILPLADCSGGFSVQDIEGLDPVKATIVTTSFAGSDGVQYHSSKRESRNVVIKLGYEPDYVVTTYRSLRNSIYSFFMPKTEVKLRLYMEDGLIVNVSGHVEDCANAIFTNTPGANISIICEDPDFVETNYETVTGYSTSTTTETNLVYVGNVETPTEFTLNINRTVSQITIYQRLPSGILRTLDIAASFQNGDVVKVSSVPDSKYVTLTRNNTTTSILYAMSPQSSWIQLEQGTNTIRVHATGDPIPYSLTYLNRYGGL